MSSALNLFSNTSLLFSSHYCSGVVALLFLLIGIAGYADSGECSPLYMHKSGVLLDASMSATQYSLVTEDDPGVTNVGIAIRAGVDLPEEYTPQQIARYAIQQLEKENTSRKLKGLPIIKAECFVEKTPSPNGTSITYKVEGLSTPSTETGLNLIEALSDETFDTVKGEATLVKVKLLE